MSDITKPYDHKKIEELIYSQWEKGGYFNPDNLQETTESYSIHLPPPNVTGSLHMGHALNATISDICIRYHRMKGKKTVWFPGTDHAGIATQNVVEKQLKKEGVSRWDIGREQFIQRVWEWKKESGDIIISQLKKLGASCDWSRLRFTMDDEYASWVKKAFIHYYEKGLIYRGTRVVSWCPRCQTSLSDLEIEYMEARTHLWHIRYPLHDNRDSYIIVATTRPETMLGDTALAVNPKDDRFRHLIGKNVVVPIVNRIIPIITDDAVEMEFGTGAVKVTPAHDMLDAEIGERHHLEAIQVIDERARMTRAASSMFEGMKVDEARTRVVEELTRLHLIEKIEDYRHNMSACYRCSTNIQPLLSNQWFISMKDLGQRALQSVTSKQVTINPLHFQKIYTHWLEHVRDWTISRQIWWGHRLPVWFHEGKTEQCQKMIVSATEPKCQHCEMQFVQSEDVLDTWFSSALWSFAGLSRDDMAQFYPSNVLITDRGIINLWVARMIFSGLEFQQSVPFPNVFIHATVLTKDGKRMSKSLGTGIDPLTLIDQYGADATRFGIVWQTMGNQDIHWDETAVVAGKKFTNKLWNISRFILDNAGEAYNDCADTVGSTEADLKIVALLEKTRIDVERFLAEYQFGQALHTLYDFAWHHLADTYIETSKKQLADETLRASTQKILARCHLSLIKLLHSFMPFITEEIYTKIPLKNKTLLIIERW